MKANLVIGIDCSTTSCKALVWSLNGQLVAAGRSTLSTVAPRPLWHEQPAESWWHATVQALQGAIAQIDPSRLGALSITHQRETFVTVDEQGHPLRDAILWMDERAGKYLPELEMRFGKEQFHQITGKPLSGNLSIAKILWIRENEPAIFEKTAKYLDVHAYLVYRLTGLYRTGWGCADPMGLFDMGNHQWAFDILRGIGLDPDQLPEAFPPGQVIGTISREAADISGLPAGLPVVAGIGDGQASGLGTRVTEVGDAYLSLGTSVVSGTFSPAYRTSDHFRTMYNGLPGKFTLETVILGGTYTIDWFINQLASKVVEGRINRPISQENQERQASGIPPGAEGLMLVPYWNSAMNPYWDTKASGVIIGWRGIHGPGHVYRAILEGIAFEQRLHTSGIEGAVGNNTQRFIAVGGGAKSDLWCQIIADITGKPVVRTREDEAAALGTGILAAAGVGLHSNIQTAALAMVELDNQAFEPNPKRHDFYTQLFEEVYRHIYPSIQIPLARLSDLQKY